MKGSEVSETTVIVHEAPVFAWAPSRGTENQAALALVQAFDQRRHWHSEDLQAPETRQFVQGANTAAAAWTSTGY